MAADDSQLRQGELAASLTNYSRILSSAGQSEEAVEVAHKAVGHYRKLIETDPEYKAEFAGALNNLSLALGQVGRHPEALEIGEESVRLYRELAVEDPALYRSELASAISSQSAALEVLGRSQEAAAASEEAVTIYQGNVEQNPERHLPELAAALNNRANRLAANGEAVEALEAAEEAVEALRLVASPSPDRFAGELAVLLRNLSQRLVEVGRWEEALEASEESVSLLRATAERAPDTGREALAAGLSTLAVTLERVGRSEEAVASGEEAAEIWRSLSAEGGKNLPALASSLNNLSIMLGRVGRDEEAAARSEEAMELFKGLAAGDPLRFGPDLALALRNLSGRLERTGQLEQAAAVTEGAVRLWRALASRGDQPVAVALAASLNDLSILLRDLDRPEDAAAAIEESVDRYRELAVAEGRYVPDLARALSNMVATLSQVDRSGEALETTGEALAEYADSPWRGVLELARGVGLAGDDLRGATRSGWLALQALEGLDSKVGGGRARSLLRLLRQSDREGFDEAWDAEVGRPLPIWLQYPDSDPGLLELLTSWLGTPTWERSREFAEEHAATLLTERAEAELEHLIDDQPDQPQLSRHLRILREARESGIESGFAEVTEAVAGRQRLATLAEWLRRGLDDSLSYLREHDSELLDPRTSAELQQAALEREDEPALWARAGLLDFCRSDGLGAARKLLEEIEAEPPRASLLEEPWNERTLNRARIAAGLNHRDPELQFLHALMAAGTERQAEADQAIFRCRELLPSWEVLDYTRRLDDLVAANENVGGDWERLREELAERPADFRS